MIYVDYRDGSRELIPDIKKLGVEVMEDNLDSGDFAFVGHGHSGDVNVGIERKTLTDFIASRDEGRLVERQIPLMCEQYDDRYLVFEADYKVSDDHDGLILVLRWDASERKMRWVPIEFRNRYCTYRELDNMMTTFTRKRNIIRRETRDRGHTARVVVDLYWHYQALWEDHKSDLSVGKNGAKNQFTFINKKPSFARLVAAQLDKVGYIKSAEVVKQFPTVTEMCLASPADWRKIKGIGKTLSERIVKDFNEPHVE